MKSMGRTRHILSLNSSGDRLFAERCIVAPYSGQLTLRLPDHLSILHQVTTGSGKMSTLKQTNVDKEDYRLPKTKIESCYTPIT